MGEGTFAPGGGDRMSDPKSVSNMAKAIRAQYPVTEQFALWLARELHASIVRKVSVS